MRLNLDKERAALLLEGRAFLLYIGSIPYTVWREGYHWKLHGDEHVRTVNRTECSCPDSRFRERECKHVKALKEVLGGTVV